MPYSVGSKGSHGCSGYPAIKTKTGEVMGCHETKQDAVAQIQAIAISEAKKLWAGSAFSKDGAMPDGDTSSCTNDGADCGVATCKVCAKKSMDGETPAGMKNPDQCGPGWKCGKEDCMKCADKAIDTEYSNSVDLSNRTVSTTSNVVTNK